MSIFNSLQHKAMKLSSYIKYLFKNDDYDWDFEYLMDIIRWKATHMLRYFEESTVLENNKRVVKQLKYLIYLIDRWPEVSQESLDKYHKEYGEFKVEFVDSTNFSSAQRMIHVFPSKEAESQYIVAIKKGHEAEQLIKKRIFRHMERYIENWWD